MSIVVDVSRVSDVVAQDANLNDRSSTSTEDENIYDKLKKTAQEGDIIRLYELIAEDPNILCHFDKVPFCEIPLHIASEKGHTHFAMELMILKPSLASKLNVSAEWRARGLVSIDNSLVSIKGRGGITPLHHVARTGDAELLSELLFTCPSSIEDLTIKCETAVHIAVKNQQMMAFKVMKLLRRIVKVKAKNLDGKTAMDILQTHQSPCFPEARKLFYSIKERLLCRSTTTLAGYLSKNLSFIEKRNNLLGLSNLSLTRERSVHSSDHRDAILVVAILIVTATYQAGLSPPGGFRQDNSDHHLPGEMIMDWRNALFFMVLNGFAFILSLYVIIVLIVGLPLWKLIYGSVAGISIAMLASYATIFPRSEDISVTLFTLALPLMIGIMLFATFMAFIVDKRRRNRVDFQASCFSISDSADPGYLLLFSGICVTAVLLVLYLFR
ncbi:hypothetical protein IGI04_014794 [Brassica rapa subsp. trilocularis]|uniref:PGG domain-containing protein n=1 Tax=Brassica rapa subsp. trilocularis TaxID=1813537 RepID=A0ABQ7MN71_BRACM|nr:hypothetical protein IGI04_014794 [Brassica rapa subsp. trilocularis]